MVEREVLVAAVALIIVIGAVEGTKHYVRDIVATGREMVAGGE